jgi:CRP/FNR family cyclic AMP-dependent transcriptional regulator
MPAASRPPPTGPAASDGVSETYGLDVTSASLGAALETGAFAAQDGRNTSPGDPELQARPVVGDYRQAEAPRQVWIAPNAPWLRPESATWQSRSWARGVRLASRNLSELTTFVGETFRCQEEVAVSMAGVALERAYRSGGVIIRQDDVCAETYLLTLGQARASAVGRSGASVLLYDLAPGDLFGALVQPASRSEAEVVAVTAACAAVFGASDFLWMMERHSCVGLTVSRLLLLRLRTANERIVDRNTLTAVGRIHAELLRRAAPTDWRMPWPVLKKLADDLQTTRETVSRVVSALQRRGIVSRAGDAMVIVAPRRLEAMIE